MTALDLYILAALAGLALSTAILAITTPRATRDDGERP
jgi:hypothetical protein